MRFGNFVLKKTNVWLKILNFARDVPLTNSEVNHSTFYGKYFIFDHFSAVKYGLCWRVGNLCLGQCWMWREEVLIWNVLRYERILIFLLAWAELGFSTHRGLLHNWRLRLKNVRLLLTHGHESKHTSWSCGLRLFRLGWLLLLFTRTILRDGRSSKVWVVCLFWRFLLGSGLIKEGEATHRWGCLSLNRRSRLLDFRSTPHFCRWLTSFFFWSRDLFRRFIHCLLRSRCPNWHSRK